MALHVLLETGLEQGKELRASFRAQLGCRSHLPPPNRVAPAYPFHAGASVTGASRGLGSYFARALASIEHMVEAAQAHYGHLDILVNIGTVTSVWRRRT